VTSLYGEAPFQQVQVNLDHQQHLLYLESRPVMAHQPTKRNLWSCSFGKFIRTCSYKLTKNELRT